MTEPDPLWGTEETAAYLGISVQTLYSWRARSQKKGPTGRRIGKRVLYLRSDVLAWVDAQNQYLDR